jgi:hypothetical protein
MHYVIGAAIAFACLIRLALRIAWHHSNSQTQPQQRMLPPPSGGAS